MARFWLALAALLLAFPMAAQAQTQGHTLFACQSASGKIVRFAKTGNLIRYSYGKLGAASDLAFAVPSASATFGGTSPQAAGSWWINREITVMFNGASYTGHWAFNRADQSEEGGVTVKRAGRILAETACKGEITMDLPEPAE
jgi:hypothetical protein